MPDISDGLSGGIGAAVGGVLSYLSIRAQVRAGRQGNQTNVGQRQQEEAFDAWRELLKPIREELATVREELEVERVARRQTDAKVEALTNEVARWQKVAKTLARWGISMRDKLRSLGHDVPAEPDELMSLRIVSDAEDL